jgi:tetratricopeptide (TPR) repeat protein
MMDWIQETMASFAVWCVGNGIAVVALIGIACVFYQLWKASRTRASLDRLACLVSQETGVPLAVLQAVLASMGKRAHEVYESSPANAEAILRLKASEYNPLKAQLSCSKASDIGIQQLKRDVVAEMDKGQFNKANNILLEIRRREQEALTVQQVSRQQCLYSAAETSAMLAGIASIVGFSFTPRGYRTAARCYAEAAKTISEIDPMKAREYRRQQAWVLDELGRLFRDRAAQVGAIDIYRGVLQEISKENEAEEWAEAQNNLGYALLSKGDPRTLQESVAAFRAALNVYTCEKAPLDWARAQHNLGSALGALGERKKDPRILRESVAALRLALDVFKDAQAKFTERTLARSQAILAKLDRKT